MRHRLGLVLAVLLTFLPLSVQAHDGSHSPDMLAVVNSASMHGHTVALSVTITGLGGPLVLTGLSAPGAQRVNLTPVYVNFAQDVVVQAVLHFTTTPPEFFTLELDFGPIGQGTVSVVPKSGG